MPIHHPNSGPSFEGRNTVIVFTEALISSRALDSQFAKMVKIKTYYRFSSMTWVLAHL